MREFVWRLFHIFTKVGNNCGTTLRWLQDECGTAVWKLWIMLGERWNSLHICKFQKKNCGDSSRTLLGQLWGSLGTVFAQCWAATRMAWRQLKTSNYVWFCCNVNVGGCIHTGFVHHNGLPYNPQTTLKIGESKMVWRCCCKASIC